MSILVSGGAGYIGSHTCVELLNAGYDIVVADNYYNSCPEALKRVREITGKDFKFVKAVIPGDRLEIKAECLRGNAGLYEFDVKIYVEGNLRAKGDLMFTSVDKESIFAEE